MSDPTHHAPKLFLLAAVALAGCISGPNFDREQLVKTPRILAIVADHPDAPPGQDVRLRALVVDPLGEGRPLTIEWTACVNAESLMGGFGGAQYGMEMPERGCDAGQPNVLTLANEGDVGVLPGVVTMLIAGQLEMLQRAFGDTLPPDFLQRLADDVGLPLSVQATVRSGTEVLIRGFKRVLIRNGDPHGTNPPQPRFRIDDRWFTSDASTPETFECVPEDGGAPTASVMHGTTVPLVPDPNDSDWLETYQVLDPQGGLLTSTESAYYSWFATAGGFFDGTTQAPTRDNSWAAPADVGPQSLWMIVRDGHGGTSGCRVGVTVE